MGNYVEMENPVACILDGHTTCIRSISSAVRPSDPSRKAPGDAALHPAILQSESRGRSR